MISSSIGKRGLSCDGKTVPFDVDSVVAVSSNAVRSDFELTDCRFIDVFHPVREAYH